MIMAQKNEIQETARIDALFERISALIEQARNVVVNTAKAAEVKTRYEVGRYIFEDEQKGERAAYGKQNLVTIGATTPSSVAVNFIHPTKMLKLWQHHCHNWKIWENPLKARRI